ncbi:MAG: ABC transporter ATP-binding protein [Chloroflexi bacterium CG_4_9_14_3_um_filter_45_9]|nr:MAG: ABC transporter ATP-binding protein [Dehalococcoidia bacterium CG2_30_46_9]PIU23361.1 MAG: ABC transporter ATP-binding protein [Chloroflexi bacterium CG08_land_8_20_14_0_20_45_12]PIX27272.1 MAG: ABC transporter ATP-binding protein [Chloroflexi bacterium CG_4_8_14_3_um_filter_45_15]PJB50402.1 MAG: ABC transporter ATP-binding protein [Chloroflexi bacterium CG_4_9_14_3_um_filter_45_9]
MAEIVVETTNLTKKYDGFTAVDGLNLHIEEGEIFGFLGPNGAGKTTTLLMLLGLTEPTSGTAQVCGHNPTREPLKVKRLVGYLPEKVGFYEDLTARQNLRYTAELNHLPGREAEEKITDLLTTVGLSKVANQEVRKLSRGMKQRLGIADILVKEPKLAFFDEPTSGIDPEGIGDILNIIAKMAKRGITVIFCSHQLPQVQKICTRVGILAKGRFVAEGPLDRLGRQTLGGGRYRIEIQVSQPTAKLIEFIKGIKGVIDVTVSPESLLVTCDTDLRSQIARTIVDAGGSLLGMKIEEYSLEKIYKKYFRED